MTVEPVTLMPAETNFDQYLEKQLEDPEFSDRFKRAGEAWDTALQLAALGEKVNPCQEEPAE
jgi:hypothetical protein